MNRREQAESGPRTDDPESLEELIAGMVYAAHQSGELSHLYGRPLDLSDDGPDWMVRHVLKRAGVTHPLVEQLGSLNRDRREADAIVERLAERRRTHASRVGHSSAEGDEPIAPAQVRAFNASRDHALAQYRIRLDKLSRRIRDHNLTAPLPLQQRPIPVDACVNAAAQRVPPIETPPTPARSHRPRWTRGLRRR